MTSRYQPTKFELPPAAGRPTRIMPEPRTRTKLQRRAWALWSVVPWLPIVGVYLHARGPQWLAGETDAIATACILLALLLLAGGFAAMYEAEISTD